jgi:hypothetical protein
MAGLWTCEVGVKKHLNNFETTVALDEILYGFDDIESTSTLKHLTPKLQPLQNDVCLNFCGGWNFWTHWWIWMKYSYCMEVMLKMTSIPYYLIS